MNDPTFWLLLAGLIAVIWYMNKASNKEGYRIGTVHGFALGIDQVADILIKRHMIVRSDDSQPLTKDELVKILTPLVTANVIDNVKKERI